MSMSKSNIANRPVRSLVLAMAASLALPSMFSVNVAIADILTHSTQTNGINASDFEQYISNKNLNDLDPNFYNNIDNKTNINLENASNSNITVIQKSRNSDANNNISIKSVGDSNTILAIQNGTNNDAYILTSGSKNLAYLYQQGFNNNAVINQDGSNNEAAILQKGSNNYDIIEQNGYDNSAILINKSNNDISGAGSQITQTGTTAPVILVDGMSNYSISVSSK